MAGMCLARQRQPHIQPPIGPSNWERIDSAEAEALLYKTESNRMPCNRRRCILRPA
jgi:hypothetical protein